MTSPVDLSNTFGALYIGTLVGAMSAKHSMRESLSSD